MLKQWATIHRTNVPHASTLRIRNCMTYGIINVIGKLACANIRFSYHDSKTCQSLPCAKLNCLLPLQKQKRCKPSWPHRSPKCFKANYCKILSLSWPLKLLEHLWKYSNYTWLAICNVILMLIPGKKKKTKNLAVSIIKMSPFWDLTMLQPLVARSPGLQN